MADVKITYGNLREIKDSYTTGENMMSALYQLRDLEGKCDNIEEEIATMSGSFVDSANDRLQDVRDSIRGLKTSYKQIGREVDKYTNRMEGILKAKSEDGIIYVNDGIGDYRRNIKDAEDNCKDALKSNVWNIHTVVLKSENQNLKDLANMSIDNYNEYAASTKRIIADNFDLINTEIDVLKDWNESDYHEVARGVVAVAKFGITVAICTTGVGAAIVAGVGITKAFTKMYRHGYSLEASLAGGAVVGATDWLTGKAGGAIGNKASEFAQKALTSKSGTIATLTEKTSKELLDGKLQTEWAENMLRNNTFVEYIEGKADGIEISRYIKGENFEALQTKFKIEFDSNVTFDRISSDEVLENYIKEANLTNANIDLENEAMKDQAAVTIEKYEKLAEFFERTKPQSRTEMKDIQDVFIDQIATEGVKNIEDLVISGDDGLQNFLQATFDQTPLGIS